MDFKDYPKQRPPKKREYIIAFSKDGQLMQRFSFWDGECFTPDPGNITHFAIPHPHPSSDPVKRQIQWANDLYDMYKDVYPKSMLKDFYYYWGQLIQKGRNMGKMRWEDEKTWQTNLRLKTFYRNAVKKGDIIETNDPGQRNKFTIS